MDRRFELQREVAEAIQKLGYPEEFGQLVAGQLRTEKPLARMLGYLRQARPKTAEEIADEMLAILDDRDRWIDKKKAEYYNQKANELMWNGFGEDGES